MIKGRPWVQIWRLVLEAQTPLSIGTGRGDGVNDVVLAHDANGLPMLPGSAIAGVLRQCWAAAYEAEQPAQALFGYVQGDRGEVSRLITSHGHIHDSHDCPVEGMDERGSKDSLLKPLLIRRQQKRQRVRINERGSADDKGLFDRSVLPAGHRFSLELQVWSATASDAQGDAKRLEGLLAEEGLRLGGLTRTGLGQLRVVRSHSKGFDLRQKQDFCDFRGLARSLGDVRGLLEVRLAPHAPAQSDRVRLSVSLRPEAGFRFGGGIRSLQRPASSKLANDLPVSETLVVWEPTANGMLGISNKRERALIPATGIKGPLSHRVAFHANCRNNIHSDNWVAPAAVPGANSAGYDKTAYCPTVRTLFGWQPEGDAQNERGQAGVLWWSDISLVPEAIVAQTQCHNSIDRFTGGVRKGALFTAENIYAKFVNQDLLVFDITLDVRRARDLGATPEMLQDFESALDDLIQGRLALGADSAGGQGFFTGAWAWKGNRPELGANVVEPRGLNE